MSEQKTMSGVYEAIFNVMANIDAVAKGRRNQQQGYAFRGIEDIYNAIHPLCAKHGLVTFPRVLSREEQIYENKNGTRMIRVVMQVEYDFVGRDGSIHTCGPIFAEAMDSADKASNKALSVAHKYAMLQTLMIPTEDIDDPDRETPGLTKEDQPKPAAKPEPKPISPALPERVEQQQQKKQAQKKAVPNRAEHLQAMADGKWTLDQAQAWVASVYKAKSTSELSEVQYKELCDTFRSFSYQQAVEVWKTQQEAKQ